MDSLDVEQLRKAIAQAGQSWRVRELTLGERPHALGWEPSDAHKIQRALLVGESIARARFPHLKAGAERLQADRRRVRRGRVRSTGAARGVIGPVRDQGNCGSCVSFCTTGLVCAMAGIELGAMGLEVSEADQHFASSHGPNCGGWNNDDALNQIKVRGVSTDNTFPYMTAFDNPPISDSGHAGSSMDRAQPGGGQPGVSHLPHHGLQRLHRR